MLVWLHAHGWQVASQEQKDAASKLVIHHWKRLVIFRTANIAALSGMTNFSWAPPAPAKRLQPNASSARATAQCWS